MDSALVTVTLREILESGKRWLHLHAAWRRRANTRRLE